MSSEQLESYATLFRAAAAEQNLMSRGDLEQLEKRHIGDCLELLNAPHFRPSGTLLDIGSGGGLPGVVLGIACPELLVTCLDSEKRKCEFLSATVAALRLTNLSIICGRAEELGHQIPYREQFDQVTSRACIDWPMALELAAAFVRSDGYIFLFGSQQQKDSLSESKVLNILPLRHCDDYRYQITEDLGSVIGVFQKTGQCLDKYPRKWKHIKTKPI